VLSVKGVIFNCDVLQSLYTRIKNDANLRAIRLIQKITSYKDMYRHSAKSTTATKVF